MQGFCLPFRREGCYCASRMTKPYTTLGARVDRDFAARFAAAAAREHRSASSALRYACAAYIANANAPGPAEAFDPTTTPRGGVDGSAD